MQDEVPEAYKTAAEEVRSHLVALRGGAPFLAPDDARLLVEWLDRGIPVPVMLHALERASVTRRKRRERAPLRLTHAKRHLGMAMKLDGGQIGPPREAGGHPLEPLAGAIRDRAAGDGREPELAALAERLVALSEADREALLREALGEFRAFFQHAWDAMPAGERDALLAEARELYADVGDVDEHLLHAAAEEHARDRLRSAYPLLTAAALWEWIGA